MKTGFVGTVALVILLASCMLASCGNKLQTREAVERGIRKGVAQRGVNVEAMDVSVTTVNFRGNEADAVVAFIPKGGKISDGLTMRYTMEQRDREWVIKGRSQLDMKQHTGGNQPGRSPTAPGVNDPHAGSDNQSGSPLPTGHPPLTGTPQ